VAGWNARPGTYNSERRGATDGQLTKQRVQKAGVYVAIDYQTLGCISAASVGSFGGKEWWSEFTCVSAFGLPSVAHPTSLTVTAVAMQIDQIDSDSRRLFRTVQTSVGLSSRELAAAECLGKACGAVTNRFYVSRGKPLPEAAHFGPKAITDLGTEQPKPVQSQRPLHCPNPSASKRPGACIPGRSSRHRVQANPTPLSQYLSSAHGHRSWAWFILPAMGYVILARCLCRSEDRPALVGERRWK
jgi:hypothetical protein